MSQLKCPSCLSALRLAQEVPAGAQIKCPKCGTMFAPGAAAVEAMLDDEEDVEKTVPNRRRPKEKKDAMNGAMTAVTAVALILLIVAGIGAAVGYLYLKDKKEKAAANAPPPGFFPMGGQQFGPGPPPGQRPSAPPQPQGPPEVQVGRQAMEIEAADLDGKTFKLSDYRGKVVVLDFWGNW
jgi:hypothetical protein